MTYARRETIAPGEVGIYHCVTRCVRRAFLCGEDPLTGKNFDHRKTWVRERLEVLAGIFGIEVCGYAALSNHLHLVLRSRPDLARDWSDADVAARWLRLFHKRRRKDGTAADPEEQEIAALVADRERCATCRERLSNVSWFMRCLAEPIARRANREDGCKGRFWEGRFKCQMLLDDAAVLACSLYVDLNPIRAGIAETPEESQFTSAYDRIQGLGTSAQSASELNASIQDDWLCVLPLAETDSSVIDAANLPSTSNFTAPPDTLLDAGAEPVNTQHECAINSEAGDGPLPAIQAARDANAAPARRASNKGFLRMKLEEYLSLLDWTGRQIRTDKRGAVPADLAPILDRLQIRPEKWVESIQHFGRWFGRAVGTAAHVADAAKQHGRQWYQGVNRCAASFQ